MAGAEILCFQASIQICLVEAFVKDSKYTVYGGFIPVGEDVYKPRFSQSILSFL